MLKRYELKLSDTESMIHFEDGDRPERECEIEMLVLMFEIAGKTETDRKQINSALDSAGRVENLKDTEDLVIDAEDLKFIDAALKAAAGAQRPYSWIKCKNLLKQLANLKEIES